MRPILLAAAALALAAAAQAPWDWGDADVEETLSPEYAETKALCRRLRGREPPASDRPSPASAAALKGCDSEALYYGIGRARDPVKARQCAFLEAGGRDEGYFSGRALLMTIYANGRGATRDLDVAIHLACGIEGAPMETHGRITHLAERKAKGGAEREFDFCDDITSGLAMGHCAAHHSRIEGARREAALAALGRSSPPALAAAFARLRQAHEAFVVAHGGGEVDMSGTARAAMAFMAEDALRDELLALLEHLSAGRAPPAIAGGYKGADARLNAAYRALMAATEPVDSPGAVTREGIRGAQRAWLRYRDAFLAFTAARHPNVPRDRLAAWLTEKRTAMLAAEE